VSLAVVPLVSPSLQYEVGLSVITSSAYDGLPKRSSYLPATTDDCFSINPHTLIAVGKNNGIFAGRRGRRHPSAKEQ